MDKFHIKNNREIEPLNMPKDWGEINTSAIEKYASSDKSFEEKVSKLDLGGFDIIKAIKENPEHLFVKVFAIKKDEVNDNGDYFSEEELKKAAKTFIGVPVFVNHQNDDIEKARGKVVHSWWDDEKGGIYTINMVDKVAYPRLARGIEAGYVTGSSMGCFPAEMRVLMASGIYKQICDVRSGDEIITHTGNIEVVENVQIHEDKTNDDLIVIKAEGIPTEISSTKEHPFFVIKKQDHCIVTGEYMGLTKSHRKRFEKKAKLGSYQMVGYKEAFAQAQLEPYDFEWKEAKDLQEGDMLCFPISDHEIDDDNATEGKAKLIGYFLAEGSYLKRKGKYVEVQFCFSYDERNTFVSEVVDLIRKEFPKANKPWVQNRLDKNISVVHVYGNEISEWFYKHCGEYSHGKKLNKKCLYWPKDVQKSIIAGWINGDGCHRKVAIKNEYNNFAESIDIATVSENLHYQMRFLLSRIGVYSTSCSRHPLGKKKVYYTSISACESYKLNEFIADSKRVSGKFKKPRLRVTEDYILIPIKKIYKKYNNKPVYNLEISNDNSFIVEGVAVHNCSVKYSCCSICHIRAANAKEYCSHIKERKKKNFTGEHDCNYHKSSGAGDEPCPVCGCKKGEKKNNKYAGHMVFEHNYGVKFIEDSFVVNPACHDCLVSDIINPAGFLKKVAEIRSTLEKIGVDIDNNNSFGMECSDGSCSLHKDAGKKEIMELNGAMNNLERVARSMMAQKNKISLEYVSDIIKATSDIQKISDELVEMGYAMLPSPTENQIAYGTDVSASPLSQPPSASQVPVSSMPQPAVAPAPSMQPSLSTPAPAPMSVQPQSAAQVRPSIAEFGDDIGRVTKPNFIPVSAKSSKDFIKLSNIIINRLSEIEASFNYGDGMKENSAYKYSDGDNSVVIQADTDGEVHVAYLIGDRMVKWANADTFNEEINSLIHHNPEQAARKIMHSFLNTSENQSIEESKISMENNNMNKVAQHRKGSEPEVTTEAQLNSVSGIHARKGDAPSAVTESSEQLGSGKSHSDVGGTSATPRQNSAYETVVEETMNSKKDGYMARWGSFPEVITEAQWTDISREVFANIPSDWTSVAKEGQLEMLKKNFSWTEPTATTEAQLAGKTEKKASAKDLIKQAQAAVADAIGVYGISASDVSKASAFINSDSSRKFKANCMVAINASPWAVDHRLSNNRRIAAFSKVASEIYGIEPVDSLISAVADNLGKSSSSDVLDALAFVVNNKIAMQQAEEMASERLSEIDSEDNSESIFRQAFSEMALPEDGMIKVCMSAEDDLGMEVSSGKDFVNAVHKFAQSVVNDNFNSSIEVVPVAIDVDEDNGLVEATCKMASHLTEDERSSFEKWASSNEDSDSEIESSDDEISSSEKRASLLRELDSLEKEAQLAGGQMPASLNPAGMGMGAQLPGGAPPAGAPGVEALTTGAPGAVDPAMAGAGEMGMDDPLAGGDMEMEGESKPKPPGAVCVVCGGNDVDVAGGKSKCNGPGCGLGYTIKIVPDATLLDKITDGDIDQEDVSEPEAGAESPEKGLGGMPSSPMPGAEGMPQGAPGAAPGGMAVAASTRITPDVMRKFASKGKFGSISPITGNTNTIKLDSEHWQCLDSGQVYRVRLAASKKKPSEVWAQWEWNPMFRKAECSPCRRQKNAIIKALSGIGISEDQFDGMSMMDKAAALDKVNASNLLRSFKEASSLVSARDSVKQAFTVHGEFPMETCLEKIARRYGDNALALSGPCEGSNLAECVCRSLAEDKVYSTGLANKIASSWSAKDPMVECVEDYVRGGLGLDKASQACEDIKSKYISAEEVYAEEISDKEIMRMAQNEMEEMENDEDPFSGEDSDSMDISGELSGSLSKGDDGLDLDIHIDPEVMRQIEESISEMSEEDVDSDDSEMGMDDEVEVEIGEEDEVPDFDSEMESEEDVESEEDMDSGEDMDSEEDMDFDSEMESEEDMDLDMESEEDMDSGEDMGSEEDMESESEMYKESPDQVEHSAEEKMAQLEREAASLKRGRIVGVNKLNIDIDYIKSALRKQAGESKLKEQTAQDSVGAVANGKPHKDSTQEGFSAEAPDVPENGGKPLSSERGDGMKEDVPSIPTGGGQFKGEDNYEPEMQDAITGGQSGQGSKHTGKYKKSSFEEALAKLAKEMSLNVTSVQDDKDLGTVSTGKPHKDSTQEGFSAEAPDVPDNGGKPLSSEHGDGFHVDSPKIPAGDGQMGHEGEVGLDSEKQNEITGGLDGQGGAKNYKGKKASSSQREAAIKLAGRMVERGVIKADQLPAKLAELQRYEVSQLRDLEKAMFSGGVANKGLKVASSGVEQPLVISEASSQKNASTDLKGKIASLFRLQQQVELAQESEATKLKAFK